MTMRFAFRLSVLFVAALLAACASSRGGPRGGGQMSMGPIGLTQPSALLAQARDFQARGGCPKAAPVYRIVASHGDGHDVAQYELGACLLEMQGESDAETALFRQEALFWLSRAAWAGNARAQGRLAEVLSGADLYKVSLVAPDPVAAMMWSIVYDGNGTREVYGLRALPPMVRDHLAAALTPQTLAAAQREAASFSRIEMAGFVPTARDGEDSDGGARGPGGMQGPPEGGRRRRPQ